MSTRIIRSFADLDNVTGNHGQMLWQRTLQRPLDFMTWHDARTMHAVTPVVPPDPAQPAFRDVMVVGFTKVQS